MSDERGDLFVLGRVLGTITGWDCLDELIHTYYNFEPAPGIALPAAEDIGVDFGMGRISIGEQSWDMIEILRNIPAATS